MRVERLEIAGFKSFADAVAITFAGGATAVVGPNGCGKSNIADAIFWVVGELGAGAIRGRGEELIFSGNAERKPLGVAEVRLHLSGLDRDGSPDAVVGRRVDRSGRSAYEIDGRRSTRKEVLRLLAGTGLSGRSYGLIEQGRMGEVLSRPPEELRRFIEEAAGLGRYRQDRRESEENLRAAERALAEARQRMADLDARIRRARRDARHAGEAKQLEATLRRVEIAEQLARRRDLEARIAEGTGPLERLAGEVGRRRASLLVLERRLDAMRTRLDRCAAELREAVRLIGEARRRRGELDALLREGARAGEARRIRRERRLDEERAIREAQTRRRAERGEQVRRAEALDGLAEEAGSGAASRRSGLDTARSEVARAVAALEAAQRAALKSREAAQELAFRLDQHERSEERLLAVAQRLGVERQELVAREAELDAAEREAARELQARVEAESDAVARWRNLDRLRREQADALEEARAGSAAAERDLGRIRGGREAAESLVRSREQLGPASRKLLKLAQGAGLDLPGAVGEALDVDEGYEKAAERVIGVHRIRVRRAAEVRELQRLAEGAGVRSWEALVGELVGGPAPEGPREGDRLRRRVRSEDPALSASIPDAAVVPDLDAALAAYAEAEGSYVTPAGDSVTPSGLVRVGLSGPGTGFLGARRDLARLEAEEAEADRAARERADEAAAASVRLEDASRELDRAAGARDEARRARERAAGDLDSGRRRLAETRRALAAADASRSENDEDRERNREALEGARRAIRDRRRDLEAHENRVEAAREESQAAGGRAREAESEWEAAERESHRAAAEAERARQGLDAARRQEEQDERRLSGLAEDLRELEREDLEWTRRREEAGASAVAAERDEAELGARETELARGERELSNRLEAASEPLLARRAELRAAESAEAAARAELGAGRSSLSELEDEFRRRYGKSAAEAARALPADLGERGRDDLAEETDRLRAGLERMGPVNETAGAALTRLEEERARPAEQLQDVESGVRDGMRALARHDIDARKRFGAAFDAVDRNFAEAFEELFGGGRASLRLVERHEPEEEDARPASGVPQDLEAGVEILGEPPGKKLRGVRLLSGGERAMTAIAFLIALFRFRPAPFCLLDEADAPLDDQNVERFAAMLGRLRATTQLVVITHNRHTMESCDHLYGVTMEEPGVSRVVSLDLRDAAASDWLTDAEAPSA